MKNLTALIALPAVFTLAVCFILIGSISEEIKVALGIDNPQAGSLASAMFLTNLAVQLFVGVLVDKHVLCEKPIARNADEARRMLDAAQAAGIRHMVAFNYRRVPAMAEGNNLKPDFEDGLRCQLVLDASEQSAWEKKWIGVSG